MLLELGGILDQLTLPITEIIGSGGGETKFTQRLRKSLTELGWKKHSFEIKKDDRWRCARVHIARGRSRQADRRGRRDRVRDRVEQQGPFFDRDLLQDALWSSVYRFTKDRGITNYDDLAASGYIPTPKQRVNVQRRVERTKAPVPFAKAWTDNFVGNKFGQATTHWSKLIHRVERGVGYPCPLPLIGLPASMVTFDAAQVEQLGEDDVSAASPGAQS